MKDHPTSRDGPFQRLPIAQISGYFLYFQFTNFIPRPDQGAHIVATLQQLSSYVPANETGRTGNQRRFHKTSGQQPTQARMPVLRLIPANCGTGILACVDRKAVLSRLVSISNRLSKRPSHQLERIAQLRIDSQRRRRLKAAVHHAVVAARIVARSVRFPLSSGH